MSFFKPKPATGWGLFGLCLILGLVLVYSVWSFAVDLITPLLDMTRGEAALSIAPGSLAEIFALPVMGLLLAIGACGPLFGRRAEKRLAMLLVKVLFPSLGLMLIALIAATFGTTPLLESYGYHRCVGLRGEESATSVISAWVRDPKWCQPGKGVDWVREQAAKERG